MPTDYIKRWDIYRDASNPPTTLVDSLNKILTVASPFQIPAPGSPVTVAVNEDISWVTKATGTDRGDYFNLETKGQFRVTGTPGGNQLILVYSSLSDAPNNQHQGETAGAGLKFTQASYRDTTAANPTLYYKEIGVTDQGQNVPQNVVSLSGTQPGQARWATAVGYAGYPDILNAIAVDADRGSCYVAGAVGAASAVVGQGMIWKLSTATGAVSWAFAVTSAPQYNVSRFNAVAITSDGDIIIAGSIAGDTTFGDSITSGNANRNGIFLGRIRGSDGTPLWAKCYHETSSSFGAVANGVALDPAGNIYICGTFGGTVDFGGHSLTSNDALDCFIARVKPDGSSGDWAIKLSGAAQTEAFTGITADASSVYAVGYLQGSTTFGSIPLNTQGEDILLCKLNAATGAVQSAKVFGSGYVCMGWGICQDLSGNVVITGQYGQRPSDHQGCDFGDGNRIGSLGTSDFFIAAYAKSDLSLVQGWPQVAGNGGEMYGKSIACDSVGNFICAGTFSNTGQPAFIHPITSNGGYDVFAVKYSPSAVEMWAKNFGSSTFTEESFGVGAASDGPILVGTFTDSFTLGPGVTLTSHGGKDGMAFKMAP